MGQAARVTTAARDQLTRAVLWAPARNSIKYVAHAAAWARGSALVAAGRVPQISNVYAASCPKSGSQWIKAVLDHPLVRKHTGLFTLPQLDYYQRALRGFPVGTFVPGLYLSYEQYSAMPKARGYRTVYIFRDPRDIVVSGYFSGLETHREMLGLAERRARMREMTTDEGLLYALKVGETHLRDMASWAGLGDDPHVRTWRLEDISADPRTEVRAILAHCGVDLDADEFASVLDDTSRETLQRKDLEYRKEGQESHYRIRRQGFRELFKPEHYEAVDRVVPGLVQRLGYPA